MSNVHTILTMLTRYGYLFVFLGVLLESAGVPLPGETILIIAGVLVHNGRLNLGETIAFGFAAAVVGDQVGYLIGRRGGRPFIVRWGRYVGINQNHLGKAEAFFERHGGKAVFLARFVTGLRVFGALMAGVSRMRWTTFFVYNTLGGLVWATSAVLAGFFLGSSYTLIEPWIGRASGALLVLLLLIVIGYVVRRRFHLTEAKRTWLRARIPSPILDAGGWIMEYRWPVLLLLGCVLAPLAIIGEIITEVFVEKGLPWDVTVLQFAHRHATPQLDHVMLAITNVGGVIVMAPATAIVDGLFVLAKRYRHAAFFALSCLGAVILNQLAKAVFQRPRPSLFTSLAPEHSYSFPSGHAMGSMAFAAALVILAWNTRWRWPTVVAGATFTLAIGASRVYLGVHYPTDILAGWLASLAWVMGLHLIFTAPRQFSRPSGSHGQREPEVPEAS